MSRRLVVLPDDSAQPILDAIDGATKSLRIKMFIFTDPSLLQAVIRAKKRGVNVRVMLNPKRRSGESENDESRATQESLPPWATCIAARVPARRSAASGVRAR